MNRDSFKMLSEKLIKKPEQRKAVEKHMLEGMTAYAAEKDVYGRVVNSVGRDAKRIQAEFEFCLQVICNSCN